MSSPSPPPAPAPSADLPPLTSTNPLPRPLPALTLHTNMGGGGNTPVPYPSLDSHSHSHSPAGPSPVAGPPRPPTPAQHVHVRSPAPAPEPQQPGMSAAAAAEEEAALALLALSPGIPTSTRLPSLPPAPARSASPSAPSHSHPLPSAESILYARSADPAPARPGPTVNTSFPRAEYSPVEPLLSPISALPSISSLLPASAFHEPKMEVTFGPGPLPTSPLPPLDLEPDQVAPKAHSHSPSPLPEKPKSKRPAPKSKRAPNPVTIVGEGEDKFQFRCVCNVGYQEGDATIACDRCDVWQHMLCMGIEPDLADAVPDTYHCELCAPREVDTQSVAFKQRLARVLLAREALRVPAAVEMRRRSAEKEEAAAVAAETKTVPGAPVPAATESPAPTRSKGKKGSSSRSAARRPPLSLTQLHVSYAPSPSLQQQFMAAEEEMLPAAEAWAAEYMTLASDWWRRLDVYERAKALPWPEAGSGSGSGSGSPGEIVVDDKPLPGPERSQSAPPVLEHAPYTAYPPLVYPALPPLPNILIKPIPSPYPASERADSTLYARPPQYGLFASDTPIPPGTLILEHRSVITPRSEYISDPTSQYAALCAPKAHVRMLGPPLNLALDAREWGNEARFARTSCHPNALLRPILVAGNLRFGLVSSRLIQRREEIVLGWDWEDGCVVHWLLDEASVEDELELEEGQRRAQELVERLEACFLACACGKGRERDCVLYWLLRVGRGENGPFRNERRKGGRKVKRVDLGPLVGVNRGWDGADGEGGARWVRRERVGGEAGERQEEQREQRELELELDQEMDQEMELEQEGDLEGKQEEGEGDEDQDQDQEQEQEQDQEQDQDQTEEDQGQSADQSRSVTPRTSPLSEAICDLVDEGYTVPASASTTLRPPPQPAPSSPLSSAPPSVNGDTTPSTPVTPLPGGLQGGRKKRRLTQVLSSSPLAQSPVKLAITGPEEPGPAKRRRMQEPLEEQGTIFEASPMPSEKALEEQLASPAKRMMRLSPAPPVLPRALSPAFGPPTPPVVQQELEKTDVTMDDAAVPPASQEALAPSPAVHDQPAATLSLTIPAPEAAREPTPPPAKEPTPPPAPPPVRKWTLKEWAAARKRGEVGKTLKTPAEELAEPLLSAGPVQDSPVVDKVSSDMQTPVVEKRQERPMHVELTGVEAALAPFHSPLIETKPELPFMSPRTGILMPGTPSPPKEARPVLVEQPVQPAAVEKPESPKVQKSPVSVRFQEPTPAAEENITSLQDALRPVTTSLVPPEATVPAPVPDAASKPAEPSVPEEPKDEAMEPEAILEALPSTQPASLTVAHRPASPAHIVTAPAVLEDVKLVPEATPIAGDELEGSSSIAPAVEVKMELPFTSLADALKPFVPLRSPPREEPIAVPSVSPFREPSSAKSPLASRPPISEKGKSPSPAAGGVEEGEVGEISGERMDEPRYDDDRDYRRSRSPDRRRTPPYGEPGYESRRYPQSPPRRPMYDEGRPRSPSYSGPARSPPYNAPRSPRYGQRSPRWQPRDRSPPRAPRSYPPPVSPVFHAHPGPSAPPFRAPPPGPSRGYPPLAPRAEQGYREGYEPGRGPPLGPRALYGQSPYGPPRAPYPPQFGGRGGGPPPVAPRGSFPPRGGWRGRGRGGNWR
ncbi:hypothetical protein CALVIDRAFT_55973 [Calocera viscosa TUFC12733]|uniref:SET domain-containing protein n=1 Tax=Calocera viscosa (strain TUFC12733) TaxID=1330018 RepID=A0A167NWU4_CALVF|nr:hypothetical protein CALVIDRAFT_55973 [Calocera viscosa TUFC12733]